MITIIIILLIFLILLKVGFDIKINDIKRMKEIGYDKKLNSITNKLPNNFSICKDMLEILNNKDTKIEESQEQKNTTSLYLIMQNKIVIANINKTFTRIQTIAHECIHSLQNKTIQRFNFIISNINILFFTITIILILAKAIHNETIFYTIIIAYILLNVLQLFIRIHLELDAMIKAKYLAKEYIEKSKILNEEEKNTIIKNYTQINDTGIKMYEFMLISKFTIKTIILCAIFTIICVCYH